MRSEFKLIKVKKEIWEKVTEEQKQLEKQYPEKGKFSKGDAIDYHMKH
jgi:hypothetical protein